MVIIYVYHITSQSHKTKNTTIAIEGFNASGKEKGVWCLLCLLFSSSFVTRIYLLCLMQSILECL